MKLICLIATIIERPAGQSKVLYYHTYLQSLVLFVEQTQKPRYESGCDFLDKFSTVVRRAHGARTDTSKIENNKTHTEHSKQQSNFSSRHSSFTRCYITTSDP